MVRPVIRSNKNIVEMLESVTVANSVVPIAITKDTALNTVKTDVERGCLLKAVHIVFDVCGLAGSGALQRTQVYFMKNPGANLTPPGVFTVGSSNEKKFVFKMWSFMTMRNQDGNPPFHVEEWVKIPKRYQRMGADDTLELVVACDTLTGHFSGQVIYKWYT